MARSKEAGYLFIAFLVWAALVVLLILPFEKAPAQETAELTVAVPITQQVDPFLSDNQDWEKLRYVKDVTAAEVRDCTDDYAWQVFRSSLVKLPLEYKYIRLYIWVERHERSWKSRVQVTSYVNNLRREGLIK